MKIGPRYKICKRLGSGVFEKCQTQKFVLSEERSTKLRRRGGRRRSFSDYKRQLLEKQKIRYTYGVSERQLSRYAHDARMRRDAASPAVRLYNALESRLDNMVYRLGFAETRRQARQLVAHGHILLNDRKVTIPSAKAGPGDTVTIREGSRSKTFFVTAKDRLKEHKVPAWLLLDAGKLKGEVRAWPVLEEAEPSFDLGTVLEYYSKR